MQTNNKNSKNTNAPELFVSLIIIGDEILNGRTKDLNGTWLSSFLFTNGLELKSMRFIRDTTEEINLALTAALLESDIVITSGGIGPTKDDKTKKTLASYFNKKISERKDATEVVLKNYRQFKREWTPTHNFYHFFPDDFIPINNPKGLAPGLLFFETEKEKLILSAPGVPSEFKAMTEFEFLPLMKIFFPFRFIENFQTVIRTVGIPEEKIFFEVAPSLWKDLEAFGKVSSLPHIIGIDIVISYHGGKNFHEKNKKEINTLILKSNLAPFVWQYGNKNLNELVLATALEKQKTFSFAESCTGGLLCSKITDLAGSSNVFKGGIVTYSNSSKIDFLGIPPELILEKGAVSSEVAMSMALSARIKFGSDFGISLTGFAEDDSRNSLGPSDLKNPPGTIYIGLSSKSKNEAFKFYFPGDRLKRKERFSERALLVLYELLKD